VLFRRFLGNRFAQDIFIGCGVAASISAGFNAPLAGVIFAHEAILRHFSLRAIAPIFVASISADTFDQLLFPSADTTFQLSQAVPELYDIVPAFIVLGPLLSLVAILFHALAAIHDSGGLPRSPTPSPRCHLSPRSSAAVSASSCRRF
jgi:CIC family chloride channel protein